MAEYPLGRSGSPHQWRLPGRFRGDPERQELAESDNSRAGSERLVTRWIQPVNATRSLNISAGVCPPGVTRELACQFNIGFADAPDDSVGQLGVAMITSSPQSACRVRAVSRVDAYGIIPFIRKRQFSKGLLIAHRERFKLFSFHENLADGLLDLPFVVPADCVLHQPKRPRQPAQAENHQHFDKQ